MRNRPREGHPGVTESAADATHDVGASEGRSSLSEFEFMLTLLMHGFQRWVENCMDSSGVRGLAAIDILTLHAVNRRARRRRISEICMIMNIHDTHLVSYALKKLVSAGFVTVEASGRERFYQTTAAGDAACAGYRRLREKILLSNLITVIPDDPEFDRSLQLIGQMMALYDQATRVAIAEHQETPRPPPVHTKR